MLRLAVTGLLLLIGSRAGGAQAPGLRQRMLDAEDARASDSAAIAPLVAGLRSDDVATRQAAARAFGRMERREYLRLLEPLLTDPAPVVRAEAVNAVGQIAKGDATTAIDASSRDPAWMSVQGLVRGLMASERDPIVRGVMARTLGRLPYASEEVARAATESIASLIDGTPTDAPLAGEPWFGVLHGTDALLRRFPSLRPTPGVVRVAQLPRAPAASDSGWSREANVILAAIRGRVLVASRGTNDLDDATARAVRQRFLDDLTDSDAQVRRQVVASAATATLLEDSVIARVINAGFADTAFSVQVEAVRGYSRRGGTACAPLIDASRRTNAHVALAAIDALAAPCEPTSAAVTRLTTLVREMPRGASSRSGARGSWHLGAHAAVSLARVAPDSARAVMPMLVVHPVWQVRMYAAHAAGELADMATLARLARDRADNVRDAAVVELSSLVRPARSGNARPRLERSPAIDSIFVSQLARSDNQLILDAAKALEGAREPARITPSLLATLDRLTAERGENSRDPRLELLARIETFASASNAARMRPYLADYDPAIAERAAQVLRKWGIEDAVAAPRLMPPIPVSLADVMMLENARVRVTMAPASGGRSFEMRLFTDEAPATISRFVANVRRGYYNGLTFHRVVTNFVIQGGSPNANEYVGADRFMRDEVGLRSHARGTLGISTRGRDTGDAQIFVNLIDNWRLDHDYTVFAEVTRGMDVVDAVLEGDVIAHIEIVGAR